MQLQELILHLHHPFQDLLKERKLRNRLAGLSKRKMASYKIQESPQKGVRVETEVYKARGGTLFLLYMVGFTACQKQMRCKLRVDVISELK